MSLKMLFLSSAAVLHVAAVAPACAADGGLLDSGEARILAFATAGLALLSGVALFQRRKVMRTTAEIAEANLLLKKEISEYEETCRRLERAESRLAVVLGAAKLGLWDRNVVTGATVWNRDWLAMLGYGPDDIKPSFDTWRKLIHPDDSERVIAALSAHLEEKSPSYKSEYRLRTKDGGWKWVLTSGMAVERDSSGRPVRVAGVHMDIDERKLAEQSRLEADRRYRQLFMTLLDGFALHELICDEAGKPVDYRFLEVNPQFEAITGLKAADIVGKTVRQVLPGIEAEWIDKYGEVALTGQPAHFEGHNAELNKTFEVTAFCPSRGQFACVFRDTTELRKSESARREIEVRIQHAQKLESLGLLAGGIAHDFNNLLMGILGNAELVLEQVPEGSQAHQCASEIDGAGRRGAELCRQMLAYSGKGRFVVERLNLNGAIADVSHLIDVVAAKSTSVRRRLAADLPDIEGDAAQIRQVIINLVNNAAEAIGAEQGIITIETGSGHFTMEYLSSPLIGEDLKEGSYCYLEIADTGHGMDAETANRIFDPFFSTKFTGRGLGLPAVLGIVKGHGGTIRVESKPGKGARFRVLFPAAPDGGKDGAEREAAPSVRTGAGTVLLVDDDDTVRAVGRRMLEGAGYSVLLASDGSEGVAAFRGDPDGIDCVVLDVTMPGMGGEEALRLIRGLRPDARVVMSSGYDAGEIQSRVSDLAISGFVQKPYRKKQLLEAVGNAAAAHSRKSASFPAASEKASKAAE